MDFHSEQMKIVYDLAKLSKKRGCAPFGAVIIHNYTRELIGRGHDMVALENDPTLHAEMVAIKHASRYLESSNLTDCTLYTNSEPCSMCLSACHLACIPIVHCGNDEMENHENRTIKMIRHN